MTANTDHAWVPYNFFMASLVALNIIASWLLLTALLIRGQMHMDDCRRLIPGADISGQLGLRLSDHHQTSTPHTISNLSYPHFCITIMSSCPDIPTISLFSGGYTESSRRLEHLNNWLITKSEGNLALWSAKWGSAKSTFWLPQMICDNCRINPWNFNLRIEPMILAPL